jgi:aminopeptidase N
MLAVTGGTRTSLSVEGGRTRAEYRQDRPGKYITVAVGRLQEAGRLAGTPSFQAYSVARTRGQAPALMQEAAAMARFFAEEFGPCPYPELSLVLMEGRTPGGHSPPGMVVLSQRPALLRGGLRDDPASFQDVPGFFLAHELAHQWWGQGVAGQNYRERWLSEAMAQYAAALWTLHSRGEEEFRNVMGRMARWGLRETGRGPINLGQRLGHIQGDAQIYRAVVYDKGAYVLHMLRAIVGRDAFRKGLTDVQQRFRFGKAGTDDLREALEKASGKDLAPYFREWVYGTALPEIQYREHVQSGSGGFRTSVDVRAQHLPGPVPLALSVPYPGGRATRTVFVPPEGGTFVVETPKRPGRVDVNADRGLLARVRRQ